MTEARHEDPTKNPDFKKITLDEINAFVQGDITWAQLQGINSEQLYGLAELGYRAFEQGKYEEAEKFFTGLSVMNPYDAYFHAVLGAIFAKTKRYDEALKEYSISLDLNESDLQINVNRGEIYLRQGRLEEAYEDFRRAVEGDAVGNLPSTAKAKILVEATNKIIQEVLDQRANADLAKPQKG